MAIWLMATALIFSHRSAVADVVGCATAAAQSSTQCTTASSNAKQQADQLSANASRQVQGKSAKETADMMADVTRKISAIYQGAESTCHASLATCQQECSDEESEDIADGCNAEVNEELAQLTPAHAETYRGTVGGQNSSFQSKADMPAGDSAFAGVGGAANVSGSSPPPMGPNEATNPAFPSGSASNPAFPRLGEAGSQNPIGSATNPKFPKADGVSAGSAGSAGGGSIGASGRAGNPAFPRSGDGSGGVPADRSDAASGKSAGGGQHGSAGTMTPSKSSLPELVAQYCNDSRNKSCPSCSGANATNMNRTQGGMVYGSCTSECMADPAYGRQLARACETAAKAKAAGGNSGRAPAGDSSLSQAYGPSLFIIHSRTINNMCEEFRLRCWKDPKATPVR
jgi:hypothetical protein